MITGKLKRDIDRLWTEFWQGGITNPLTVIEQITFLMFARLLDIEETADEKRVNVRPGVQAPLRGGRSGSAVEESQAGGGPGGAPGTSP